MDLDIFIKADEAEARKLAAGAGLSVSTTSDGDVNAIFADGFSGIIRKHDYVNVPGLPFEEYPVAMEFGRAGAHADQVTQLFHQVVEAGVSSMLVRNLEVKVAQH